MGKGVGTCLTLKAKQINHLTLIKTDNMEQLAKILAEDNMWRQGDEKSKPSDYDLFTLDEIDRFADWDFSLPTLVSDREKNSNHIKNIYSFRESFQKKYSYLDLSVSQLDNSNHFFMAGGCVSSLLLDLEVSDIDIFVYGFADEKSATQGTHHFLQTTIENYKKFCRDNKKPSFEIQCSVSKRCINLKLDHQTIQIILRIYPCKSDILHGFDLGSSALGYDGKQIYFTSLSKYCYERKCNVIDTTRRSTTYEKRLMKYFDRGFQIIMPELDITKLSQKNFEFVNVKEVAALPYLPFSYSDINGNKIVHSKFLSKPITNEKDASDYMAYDEFDDLAVAAFNWRKVMKNELQDLVCVQKGDFALNALHGKPYLPRATLEALYAKIELQMMKGRCYHAWQPLFTIPMGDIFVQLEKLQDNLSNKKAYVRQLISQHVNDTWRKYESIESRGLCWQTTNPGSQLCGSFNPIIEDASKWYGEYYWFPKMVVQ